MNSFSTLLGENKVIFIIKYDWDSEDELIKVEALANGKDVYDMLNPYWQQTIDARCERDLREYRARQLRERREAIAMEIELEFMAQRDELRARHGCYA